MATGTISGEGRVTIPDEVREHLHLQEGDQVEFVIKAGGEVHLRPAAESVDDLFGMMRRSDIPPRTAEEMREGMIEFLVQEDERIKRGGE